MSASLSFNIPPLLTLPMTDMSHEQRSSDAMSSEATTHNTRPARTSMSARVRSQARRARGMGPIPCLVAGCQARFWRQTDRRRHVRTIHPDAAPGNVVAVATCQDCLRSFNRKSSYKRHLESKSHRSSVETGAPVQNRRGRPPGAMIQ